MRYTLLAKATLVMTFLVVAFVIPQKTEAQTFNPIVQNRILVSTSTPYAWAIECEPSNAYNTFPTTPAFWFATSTNQTSSSSFLQESGGGNNSCVTSSGAYTNHWPAGTEIAPIFGDTDTLLQLTVSGYYHFYIVNINGDYDYFRFYYNADINRVTEIDTPESAFVTRIISTTPYNNQLTSTSTAFLFNVTGYINAEDVQSNIHIRYAYRTLLGDVVNYTFGSDISNEEMISFTATTSGNFNLSATTSVLEIGRYTGRWTIEKPTFSVFGFEFGVQTLYSTTTFFTVATTTNYDNYLAEQSSFLQYLGSEYAGVSCEGITEFFTNLGYCVYGLFVPNADQMIAIWTNFREGFLTKAPWGYGVRVYDIFVGNTATSSLVGLNLSIPVELGLPVAGATINFDPWGTLDTALDTLGTDVPVNGTEPILDTMLYYWNLFVSLAFAWWLVNFVLHHGQHPEDPHKWDEEKKQAHTPSRNTRYDRDQKIL